MRKVSLAILIGLAFGLMTTSNSHAMSELVALSMEPQWPATTQPGAVILYKITAIGRSGQGMLEVVLTSDGLPAGTVVEFSPSTLRFTGRVPTLQTAMMTVTCPQVMPTDIYPFTVTGTARREFITITNQLPPLQNPGQPYVSLFMDLLGGGDVRLRGVGGCGQTYQIQTTTDLRNPVWTPLGTTTADGNGRFVYFTSIDVNTPQRFFRAALITP